MYWVNFVLYEKIIIKILYYIYENNFLYFNNNSSKINRSRISNIGVVGAGAGIGIVFAGLVLAVSRNPGKEARLIQLTLLGFALAEAMGLLAIMMAFLILYA
jgi:F-type H+-transporting ATPase subunit c